MRGLDLGIRMGLESGSSWPLVYYSVGFFEEFVAWRGVRGWWVGWWSAAVGGSW